ncbi:ribonuclease H-like domain-containing protein [Syncephalis fuscata]|nr:ribonuclease H-like domain-containing protein [Syncephalis fuscata]
MEVLRSSFSELLPEMQQAIEECEFMAIDVEFTGLDPQSISTPRDIADTVQERYIKVRQQSVDFILCQFGLCTFRWNESRNEYEAKPFNCYLMPAGSGARGAPDRYFQCQASAIDFLARNGFDFTKWLGHGVHFMNWQEEHTFRARRESEVANDMPNMELDDRGLQFEQQTRAQIDHWITTKDSSVYINCANGYQSRIVYQLVRNCYPKLDAEGQRGFVRIALKDAKVIEKRNAQRRAKTEADASHAIGFRLIIDMIARSRKPIVGHHMIMDVCQVYHHMYKSLPELVNTFAAGILSLFPQMFDTKYMSIINPDIASLFPDTRLEDMLELSPWPEVVKSINIKCNRHFTRYNNKFQHHEAGYDALTTGIIFIRLYHTLASKQQPQHSRQQKSTPAGYPIFTNNNQSIPSLLKPYLNQLYFVKSSNTTSYSLPSLAGSGITKELQQEISMFRRALHL